MNWQKKHELELLLIIVSGMLFWFYYVLIHPMLLWQITDPIVKLMGGK